MDVTIIVATYGSDEWAALGETTAKAHGAVHVHGPTLATARNQGVERATTEWVIVLDADDSLSPGYTDAMSLAYGDLRAPSLELHYPDKVVRPDLANRDIERMNPCCIGTAIRRQMLLDCGKFWEEPAWEDYSLFRRAWLLGATITHVPDAVYRATVRPQSRNNSVAEPGVLLKTIKASHAIWLEERERDAKDGTGAVRRQGG